MTDRVPRGVLVSGAILAALTLVYLAYSRPWYFTSPTYLGALLGIELLVGAVWMYRRVFFLVVVLSFLFAGSNLQIVGGWTTIRWAVLATGAIVGLLIALKDRCLRFRPVHFIAFFVVLAALISTTVSRYPTVAMLKVLSLLLLFAYAGTGARIAATEREGRFVIGLLTGCEVFVSVNVLLYAVGFNAMGNPNSLGAVMGVVCAPVLVWGVLLGGTPSVQRRRMILYVLCMYLAFISQARAGIAAALFSSALLLLALRKYKVLIEGILVLVIFVSALAIYRPNAVPSLASSVIYKNSASGILASRVSPWQTALDNISDHPWFGMGLGTTVNDNEPVEEQGFVSSSANVTAENGSSYLALLSGLGILGALPSFVLLVVLVVKVARTFLKRFARFVARNFPFCCNVAFMGLEPVGFAKTNIESLWVDPVDYESALNSAVRLLELHEIPASIYNHQLCTLRHELWRFARQSISDWKNVFLDACQQCSVRQECCGLFSSATEIHSRAIKPIPAPTA